MINYVQDTKIDAVLQVFVSDFLLCISFVCVFFLHGFDLLSHVLYSILGALFCLLFYCCFVMLSVIVYHTALDSGS